MTLTATISRRISSSSSVLVWNAEVSMLDSGVDVGDIIQAACAGICGWIDWDWDEDGNIVRV